MTELHDATELVEACHRLARLGYGTSTSGNASLRVGERILVTSTGVAMGDTSAGNLAELGMDGHLLSAHKPSKEWGFHVGILRRRADVRIVLHVHPAHAVAASAFLEPGDWLPAVTPQFVMRLGRVPVSYYHPPGSAELATAVDDALGEGRAVLMANHGVVVAGPDARAALGVLEELEENCRQWLWVRQGGRVLSEAQVTALLGRKM